MKIVIIQHPPPFNDQQTVSGEQLRAHHLCLGLRSNGHSVQILHQGDLGHIGLNGRKLRGAIETITPDAVICLWLEAAPELEGLSIPIVLDLYAPRLQESAFGGDLSQTGRLTLRALGVGDAFLVSNRRQRWHWLGALALAGIDTRVDPTLHVPLSVEKGSRHKKQKAFTLVGGGCNWPWQNSNPGLERVLKHMDKRKEGKVRWLGTLPETTDEWLRSHKRLEVVGWLSYAEYLRQLSQASAAFDWYAPNPERELALAFRHMDYLSSGLPILGYPNTALSDIVADKNWLGDDIESILDRFMESSQLLKEASTSASTIAQQFHWSSTIRPLLDWLKKPKQNKVGTSILSEMAQNAERYEHTRQLLELNTEKLNSYEDELSNKRKEVDTLTKQIQLHLGIVDRLSRAVDEVSGFKREAIQVLDTRIQQHSNTSDALQRENAILLADIEKKSAELAAMDSLRSRLENDLQNVRAELESHKQKRRLF